MDINVDGKAIKAVALPSKEAFLYVFDRITGKPVWPIEERPVPQSDVPGEKTSPTQPFPTKPPAYARNFMKVPDDLIDFTQEMRAQALDNISRYKVTNQMFTPPIVGDPKGFLGAINLGNASGGTNWPGAGFDPELHTVLRTGAAVGCYADFAAHSASGLLGHQVRLRTQRPGIPRGGRPRLRQRGGCSAASRRRRPWRWAGSGSGSGSRWSRRR